MNYIDLIITKVLSYFDSAINFVMEYRSIFVWGFVAVLLSKLFKFNIKISK